MALKEFYAGDSPEPLYDARVKVLQFHELDETGQHFRYSRTREGERTLKNIPERVDLTNLSDTFDGLYRFLVFTQAGMTEGLDAMRSNY